MNTTSLVCDRDWSNIGDLLISEDTCYVYLPYRTAISWIHIVLAILQLIFGVRVAWNWWPVVRQNRRPAAVAPLSPVVAVPQQHTTNHQLDQLGMTTGNMETHPGTIQIPSPSNPVIMVRSPVPITHPVSPRVAERTLLQNGPNVNVNVNRRIGVFTLILSLLCPHPHRTFAIEPALRASLHTLVQGMTAMVLAIIRLSDDHRGAGVTWTCSVCVAIIIITFFHHAARMSMELLSVQLKWTNAHDPAVGRALQMARYLIWFGFGLLAITQLLIFPLAAPFSMSRHWQYELVATYMICFALSSTITCVSLAYFVTQITNRIALASTLTTLSAAQQQERLRAAHNLRTTLRRPVTVSLLGCIAMLLAGIVPWLRLRSMYLITIGQMNLSVVTIISTSMYPSKPSVKSSTRPIV